MRDLAATVPDPLYVLGLLSRNGVQPALLPQHLALLAEVVERRSLPEGKVILRKGQPSDRLYLLVDGAFEVLEEDEATGQVIPLRLLEPGSVVGEISFLDGRAATATVRTAAPSDLIFIRRDRLAGVPGPEGARLRELLGESLTALVVDRLRKSNQDHVRALKAELTQQQLRIDFGTFFIVTLLLFGLSGLVQGVVSDRLPPLQQMFYSWTFLLLTLAPMIWFTRRQGAPVATFGVTLTGWRRALGEGLALSAVIVGGMLAWRAATRAPGEPLLTWGSVGTYAPVEAAVFFTLYGPHCFLQEFIGRGAMQTCLVRFMPEARPIVPILLVSALFGIFHFYVSYSFALVTFLVSVIFGALYARHRTLLGVTLLHFVLGCGSIAIGLN